MKYGVLCCRCCCCFPTALPVYLHTCVYTCTLTLLGKYRACVAPRVHCDERHETTQQQQQQPKNTAKLIDRYSVSAPHSRTNISQVMIIFGNRARARARTRMPMPCIISLSDAHAPHTSRILAITAFLAQHQRRRRRGRRGPLRPPHHFA